MTQSRTIPWSYEEFLKLYNDENKRSNISPYEFSKRSQCFYTEDYVCGPDEVFLSHFTFEQPILMTLNNGILYPIYPFNSNINTNIKTPKTMSNINIHIRRGSSIGTKFIGFGNTVHLYFGKETGSDLTTNIWCYARDNGIDYGNPSMEDIASFKLLAMMS